MEPNYTPYQSPLVTQKWWKQRLLYFIVGILLIVIVGIGFAVHLTSKKPLRASAFESAPVSQTLSLPNFMNQTVAYAAPTQGSVKYVATNGSDSASGNTIDTPYQTICQALANVSSGGTIILRGGVYREGYNPSTPDQCGGYKVFKKVSIQSYMNERAWVKGSLVATNWKAASNGNWQISWPDLANLTSSVPASNKDIIDPAHPMAGDAAQVFINGQLLTQVPQLADLTNNTFYADRTTNTIYIHNNPQGNTVEVTAYPRAFQFFAGSEGSKIQGVGFAQFGSTWDTANTPGAVIVGASGVTLDNTVFSQNSAAGLSMITSAPTLTHSILNNNGFDGAVANTINNADIENDVFADNNVKSFSTSTCSASCTAAGFKIAHSDNVTLKADTFNNNDGAGVWCDLSCRNAVVVDNNVHDNTTTGIFYEVSSTAIIASNLVYNNAVEGIKISGSDHVRIYNNTLEDNGSAKGGLNGELGVYDDGRTPDTYAQARGLTWNTTGTSIVNNVFAYSGGTQIIDTNATSAVDASQMISSISSNAFYRHAVNVPQTLIHWCSAQTINPGCGGSIDYISLSDAMKSGIISPDNIENDSNGPLFTIGGYVISPQSSVYNKSVAIPSDILAAVGLPANMYSLGYLTASALTPPGPAPVSTPKPGPAPVSVAPVPPTTSSSKLTINIKTPSTGQHVKGVFSLSASVSDTATITKVDFYVNGYLIGGDVTAPYAVSWDTTLASDGTYPVTAVAYDSTGNVATSQPVSVVIGNSSVSTLSIALTGLINNQVVKGKQVYLQATTTGNVPVTKVNFYVNGYLIGSTAKSPYKVGWNTTLATNGTYPVLAKVYGTNGTVVSSSAITVIVKN